MFGLVTFIVSVFFLMIALPIQAAGYFTHTQYYGAGRYCSRWQKRCATRYVCLQTTAQNCFICRKGKYQYQRACNRWALANLKKRHYQCKKVKTKPQQHQWQLGDRCYRYGFKRVCRLVCMQ